ncbi:MAG TPA: hypothetical protein VK928_03380 [Longimicrobiales bacterium]|nr:hypothetical protein [Longimicrobiales bacterium]
MNPQEGSPHMDTGLLVLHLADELDAHEAAAARAHLTHCAACRERATALSRGLAQVGPTLAAADIALPSDDEWVRMRSRIAAAATRAPRHRTAVLRAAALVLLLGAAALALSPPLRAWALDQWRTLVTDDAAPTATVDPRPDPIVDAAHSVGFHAGARVDVVFDVEQLAGSLEVRFSDRDSIARIGAVQGAMAPLVIDGGAVRIANEATSRTSWTLDLPRAVERVMLRVGAGEPVVLVRGAAASSRVDLTAAPPRRD